MTENIALINLHPSKNFSFKKNYHFYLYKPMCLIIDINTLAAVFIATSADHSDFAPVSDWIFKGSGKIVYGGSTYLDELKSAGKYLKIFRLLKEKGKACELDKDCVDQQEIRVRALEPNPDFDDPHIIAIVIESKARIICSKDLRAFPYLKNNKFYPRGVRRPKIFTCAQNIRLLNNLINPKPQQEDFWR